MAEREIDKNYVKAMELYLKTIRNDVELCNHRIQAGMKEIELHQMELKFLEQARDHKVKMYEEVTDELIAYKAGNGGK